MKNISRKKHLSHKTHQIIKLIKAGKINLAKKIITEQLIKFPYDELLILQLIRIEIFEHNYEEALNNLEQLNEDLFLIRKLALCIKLEKEDKIFELYQKFFQDDRYILEHQLDKYYSYYSIYLNKKYNPNYQIDMKHLSYTEQQIYSYNRTKALEHIKQNHYLNHNNGKSIFCEEIDIDSLFEQVENYIRTNDHGHLVQNEADVYYFYHPQCGRILGNGPTDYFCVYTFVGSQNILSMYPVYRRKKSECLYLKENKPKKLVKARTGLERFNDKYDKYQKLNASKDLS